MVAISVCTYGVKIIKKFRWESGFLGGGVPWNPPLCTNGSAGYLMQLSVNGVTHSTTLELVIIKLPHPSVTSVRKGIQTVHLIIQVLIASPSSIKRFTTV